MADPTTLQDAVSALNQVATGQEQLLTQFQGKQADIEANNQAMLDWQTQPGTVQFKDIVGNTHNIPTLKTLVEDAQTVNPNPHVMTKAEFDALREMRKQQYAGSGFVEWGKHRRKNEGWKNVNQGLSCALASRNLMRLGWSYADSANIEGLSNSYCAVVIIDGVYHKIENTAGADANIANIQIPNAPSGTKTYDSATGIVTQHSSAEVAFASETDTNKVITSRKDLVFLESWHEKIADKDVVYPLGNVQYGANGYQGITLLNNLVAQGYSAFGEWDPNTKGYGVKWSSLTDEQKAVFLGEPEHNIYYDPKAKAYIQVRYRVRVVEGVGNDWKVTMPNDSGSSYNKFLGVHGKPYSIVGSRFGYTGNDRDLVNYNPAAYSVFMTSNNLDAPFFSDVGRFVVEGVDKGTAIPIALVQRLNQGAHHPTYNPFGCGGFESISGTVECAPWFSNKAPEVNSTLDCFLKKSLRFRDTGKLIRPDLAVRVDEYKFFDAIYSGQVEDLRINANKLDVNKLRESKLSDAIAGKLRGKEKLPFTKLKSGFCYDSGMTIYIYQNVPSSESSLIGSDKYYRGDDIVKSYPKHSEFKASAVAIKFTDAGDTDLTTFAGGTPLGQWFIIDRFDMQSNLFIALKNPNTGNSHWFSSGRASTIQAELLFPTEQNHAEFDALPWMDIIATPDNFRATFPDGVQGQWIPKIPDGSPDYPLNRKLSGGTLSAIYSNDLGQTWVKSDATFDSVKNIKSGDWDPNAVGLLYYETRSSFTHSSSNRVVIGNLGQVYASQASLNDYGNRLHASLTDNIGKRTSSAYFQEFLSLKKYTFFSPNQILGWTSQVGDEPLHEPLSLDAPNDNSPSFKTLTTVTQKDGLLYMQFHGAELKYQPVNLSLVEVIEAGVEASVVKGAKYRLKGFDNSHLNRPVIALQDKLNFTFAASAFDGYRVSHDGRIITRTGDEFQLLRVHNNEWGDDQTIPIISRENTKIDLNGNTVKVFCHHTMFPIGIAHNG